MLFRSGMEFVKIYSVRSIPRLLEALKNKMLRIGTDLSARSKFASDIKSIAKGKPAVVVLGNEENGISSAVRENCDYTVIIPFAGMNSTAETPNVDSLNVAQASSVIMYELTRRALEEEKVDK